MWFRRTTDQLLNEPRRISTADYLCKLMEEQNSLLREVVRAVSGQHPSTIKARPTAVNRIRTAEDVIRVNGRDFVPTVSTSGNTPNSQASVQGDSNPKPSAP